MSRSYLCIVLLFVLTSAIGQSRRAVLSITSESSQARWSSSVHRVPLDNPEPFLAYFLKWEGEIEELMIRFSPDGKEWSGWQSMPADEHNGGLQVSSLGITVAGDQFFQIKANADSAQTYRVDCHFYSPGATEELREGQITSGQARSCDELMPEVVRRTAWCPAGNCAEHPNPAFAEVSHLVIHHSAGTNVANDWAAVARAIWDLHVSGNGWSDIGYNWLVDPDGRVYEGRSDDAIGAHFCAKNTGTVGVCVMGTFTNQPPTEAAIEGLVNLLSWKACQYDIDPLGESLHNSSGEVLFNISGHRDGCNTACPGDMFYPLLPAVRAGVLTGPPTAVQGVEEKWPGLKVFPNPSHGEFQLLVPQDFPDDCFMSVYDALGRRIMGPIKLEPTGGGVQDLLLPGEQVAGTYRLVLSQRNAVIGVRALLVL